MASILYASNARDEMKTDVLLRALMQCRPARRTRVAHMTMPPRLLRWLTRLFIKPNPAQALAEVTLASIGTDPAIEELATYWVRKRSSWRAHPRASNLSTKFTRVQTQ